MAAPRVGGKSGLQRPLLALDNSTTPAPASPALQGSAARPTSSRGDAREGHCGASRREGLLVPTVHGIKEKLRLSPRVFPTLLRVVAVNLASQAVATLMYLDDWLLHSPTREGVANNVSATLRVLAVMGFFVNFPKSATTPTQQLDWLGIRWDTTTASLSLAPDNVDRPLRQVRRAYFPTPSRGDSGSPSSEC